MTTFLLYAVIAVLVFLALRKLGYERPRLGSLVCVAGGVKAGKTTSSIALLKREYKASVKAWKMRKLRGSNEPQPRIYSNVPIALPFHPLTEDVLCSRVRVPRGSIIYFQESSLVAGSMDYKDEVFNQRYLLLNKLAAHFTQGGMVIHDTQSLDDLHYAVKRSVTNVLFIDGTKKVPLLPFLAVHYRIFDNVGSAINSDTDVPTKWHLIPSSTWSLFDRYTYYGLVEEKPLDNSALVTNPSDLRTRVVLRKGKEESQ